MYDFCPLCMEKGLKRKMKAYQVTLDEAVWSCEERGCIWPFGFEEPVYLQRITGKTWSCYWDDSKSIASNKKDIVPIPTELPIFSSSDSELEDYDLQECSIDNVQTTDNVTNNIKKEDRCEKVTQPCTNNFEQINNYCNNISGSKLYNSSKPLVAQTIKDTASISLKCHQGTGNIKENSGNFKSLIRQSNKTRLNNQNKMQESIRPATLYKSTVSSTCGQKSLNNSERVTNSEQCIPQLKKVRSNSHKQKYDSIKQAVPCQTNRSSIYEKKMCNINDPIIDSNYCTKQPEKVCSNSQSQKCDTIKKAILCPNDILPNLDQNTSDHVKEPVINNEHSIKQTKKVCLNSQIQNRDSRQQAIPCETFTFDAPNSIPDTIVLNLSSSSDSDTSNPKLLHCDTEKRMHREYNNVSVEVSQGNINVRGTLEVKNTGKVKQDIPSNLNNYLELHQDNNTSPEKKSRLTSVTVNNSLVPQIEPSNNINMESGNQLQVQNLQNYENSTDTLLTNCKLQQNTIATDKLKGLSAITLNCDAPILNTLTALETDSSKSSKNVKIGSGNELQVQNVQNYQNSTNTLLTNSKLKQNTITAVKLDGLPPITPSYDASILNTLSAHDTDSSKSSKNIQMESGNELKVKNVQNNHNSADTTLTNSKLEQNTITTVKLEGLPPITVNCDAVKLNTLSAPGTDSSKSSKNVEMQSGNKLQVQKVQNYQNSTDTLLTNSKLEQNTITTVKLEGLPPITLSYDASILNTLSALETDSSKPMKPTETNISVQPRLRSTQLSKRSSAECKKYKKFSFNAIMNKMKGQQANKVESVNNLNPSSIRNADASLAIKNGPEEKDLIISTQQNSKEQAKSIISLDISSIPNTSNASCDNSVLCANTSIDSFLDDFLRNDYSMSEEINDDWLNALLV